VRCAANFLKKVENHWIKKRRLLARKQKLCKIKTKREISKTGVDVKQGTPSEWGYCSLN